MTASVSGVVGAALFAWQWAGGVPLLSLALAIGLIAGGVIMAGCLAHITAGGADQ
ncbi:hypothetical protein ACQPZP_43440 [Spirillospora sp. CA-142024]|uniref:hypothetical protein n=1 Tax=Spirillospora sp. CA-142024 TaxID=3240036 RepID=UPI003D8F9D61